LCRLAAYRPLRTEPGSIELLDVLAVRAVVLVPLLRADRDLDWTPWPSGEPLGVDAIAGVDAVLAPAVAVSRIGVRLGRGGGSYDRALARVPPGVPICALVYDDELVAELPRDDWDVPVTGAITPSGWHDLRP
jgi:5-formyltetrahydrofolate cyclo-ligase